MKEKIVIEPGYLIVEDFLNDNLYNELYNFAKNYSEGYRSSRYAGFWQEDLYKGNGVETKDVLVSNNFVYGNDTIPTCFKKFQNKIINTLIHPYDGSLRMTSSIYNWKKSSIFWHSDSRYYVGCSYYLHKEWDKNWGGELLLEDSTFHHPKPNSIVFIYPPYYHKTNESMEGAPDRFTIQSFIMTTEYLTNEERINDE